MPIKQNIYGNRRILRKFYDIKNNHDNFALCKNNEDSIQFNTQIRMKKKLPSYIIIGCISVMIGCSPKVVSYTQDKSIHSETGIPDYSQLDYWAAHPNKVDPSDSIPLPLKNTLKEKKVDVFFIHPTTFLEEREYGLNNAKIDNDTINYKTDYTSILYQASVFNEEAQIYAPRYRQAHISMYFESDSAKKYNAFNLAYEDVRNAFIYYLEHENKGRPIVIASHSQGTTHSTRLIKEFFDGKPLAKQFVCGYLIGMPVKKNQYEKIEVCMDSTSTGCFVSWRTYREDFSSDIINRLDTTIAVVNPIIWRSTNEIASRELQQGAVLYNFNKIYMHTQGAQAEGNALWVPHPKFPGSFLYRAKNYHSGDINLFYLDIRKDISRRIEYYLKK